VAQYNLDVAFSSDASIGSDPTQPITMAYGYTNNTSGTWRGAGQTKERLPPNSPAAFGIFDMAPNSAFSITSVTISSANVNPGQGTPNSPFSDSVWSSGTITATPSGSGLLQLGGPNSGPSTGCNITGKGWSVGPFTIGNYHNQRFELTIIIVGTVNGVTKRFQVDPEMVVTGDK
jgi:hypothetical protein